VSEKKSLHAAEQDTPAQLRYLPPYSPDFNPIEKCWSKVKQLLRGAKPRSLSSLEIALTDALQAVTPHNIQNCFRHCGYACLVANSTWRLAHQPLPPLFFWLFVRFRATSMGT
jgi:hypothetical protein